MIDDYGGNVLETDVLQQRVECSDEFSYKVGSVGAIGFGCSMQNLEIAVGLADGDAVWESWFIGWEESPLSFSDSRAGGCDVSLSRRACLRVPLL